MMMMGMCMCGLKHTQMTPIGSIQFLHFLSSGGLSLYLSCQISDVKLIHCLRKPHSDNQRFI